MLSMCLNDLIMYKNYKKNHHLQIITFFAVATLVHAGEREYHGDPHVGYSFAKFSGPVSGIKKSDIN